VAGARERLVRELGRFLVCLGYAPSNLNAGLYQEMRNQSPTAQRLQLVHERLGGYPVWSEQFQRELEGFSANLTEARRTGRRASSEIDAALQDPRWAAP